MEETTFALPATPKQIAYARSLALRNQTLLPWDVQQDRRTLSAWIEAQARMKPASDMDRLPTSRQVAFAGKLARIKRRAALFRTSASATRGSCRNGSTGTGEAGFHVPVAYSALRVVFTLNAMSAHCSIKTSNGSGAVASKPSSVIRR